jgi:hypothetical protein
VNKSPVPVALILAVACGGGGGDGIGPVPTPSDISTMNVGEVRVLNPGDIPNGIDLPAGSGARDYVIIVGNTNSIHDVVANYVVKADRSTDGSFEINAAPYSEPRYSLQLSQLPLARTAQQAMDNKVRAFERSRLTMRSASGPFGFSPFSVRRSAQVSTAPVPAVGDRIPIKIPDGNSDNLCINFIQTEAVVASVSNHAILAVDTLDGPPALLFTPAVLDSIAEEFDNITYPTDASYFGNPTDVDGNSQHVILLFTGEINKLTPAMSPPGSGFVGGFFFAGDFFPATDQGGGPNTFCPQSNGAEIFYLLSPDPTGRFGNVRSTSSVRQGTRGTIAHEFQHMINAGNRYQNPAVSEFESSWLDEGLAHFAEDAVGRVQRGFTDLQTLTFNDLVPCNSPCAEANDFNAFFYQNLARLTYWMEHPDETSPTSDSAGTDLATRGAAWAFLRFAADNYSPAGDPRALTRALVAGPDTGIKNFVAKTQASRDTLTKGWLVSMYADHLGVPALDSKYQYRSYNMRNVMPPVAKAVLNQTTATYPLEVTAVGSGSDNIESKNRSGTGTYYRLHVTAGASAKNIKVLDTSGTVASYQGEHIYVLRVQ